MPTSCKFAEDCRDFSVNNKRCLDGGGTSCRTWRKKTNVEIAGPQLAYEVAMKMGY